MQDSPHRPESRVTADEYTELKIRCSERTDPVSAAVVAAAANGVTLRGLANSHPPARDTARTAARTDAAS